VYDAMIAALQLAAQRLLLKETQALTEGADSGSEWDIATGNITSRRLFEKAQQVHAECLADCQFQHFAFKTEFFCNIQELTLDFKLFLLGKIF
jgi:hypothetical protein